MSKFIFFISTFSYNFDIVYKYTWPGFFFGRFKEGNFCGERIEHLYSSIYYFILENTSINNQIDLKDFMVKKITFTPSRVILLFY